MRITHNLACTIADSLTQQNKAVVAKMRKEVDALVIGEYEQFIPLDIVRVAKSCPAWIKKTNHVYVRYLVNGSGEGYYAYTDKATIITRSGESLLKLNSKSPLRRKIINLEKANEELRNLRRQVISTVKELVTSTRVIEQFPETAPLFKGKMPTPASRQKIDLSELKAKLKKQ
jgi:hypothetical protein